MLRPVIIFLREVKIIDCHDMIPVATETLITKRESATLVDKSIFVRRQISTFGSLIFDLTHDRTRISDDNINI